MFSIRRFALPLVAACSLVPGLARGEDTFVPWNRAVQGLAVAPTGDGKTLEVRVIWSAELGAPTEKALDLSTDVLVRVGNKVVTTTIPVFAHPGAGFCSDSNCGGSCGTGSVSGKDLTLLCLPDGGGCGCEFPPITTTVPVPPGEHGPSDIVQVVLTPSAGAKPEVFPNDDVLAEPFQAPIFWDRALRDVVLKPVPGVADTYDVEVEYQVAYNGAMPPQDLRTDIVMNHNGQTFVFEPWCGPWLAAPSSICGQNCISDTCAVIKCNGQTVATLSCQSYENDWGQFGCTCASSPLMVTIPSVKLKAGDQLELSLVAAAGAIPELDGLEKDHWVLCSSPAQSLPYGQGKKGTLGVPTLGSSAPPVLGQVSGIKMKEALPGAMPILFVGVKPLDAKFDGGRLLVDPAFVAFLPVPVAADGTLTLQGPAPADPNLCGISLYFQVMFQDSGASGFYHLAMTNGLQRIFGS
ncbi:MAG: hypothetical protein ACF8XB_12275 [Planctomycetota bacterium JB042]